MWRGQGKVQAERVIGPGALPLLGSVCRGLSCFQARSKLVNSDQKSRVMVSPTGVLPKECRRHRCAGRQERLLITRLLGSPIRNLHFLVARWLPSRTWTCMKGCCQLRSPQAAWLHKMDAKAAIPWSRLAQLLAFYIFAEMHFRYLYESPEIQTHQ